MERSRMPDNTAGASMPVRLLPVVTSEVLPGAPGSWSQRAICLGEDPDIFFPPYGDPGIRARQICASCLVRVDCLEHATAKDEWGIWGGLDREQRRVLRNATGEQDSPRRIMLPFDENEAAHD
jgi:WhiB family redox-sensing transcriptional regulator